MLQKQLLSEFKTLFYTDPEAIYFAPGRANLIGEHIDYNGGLVFPFAIEKGTYAAVSRRSDKAFHVYSMNFTNLPIQIITLEHLHYDGSSLWTNYIKGVLSILIERGYTIPFGLDLVIFGDLPNSSGLSSSACLEVLLCKIFNAYYELDLSATDMALIGQAVENKYLGLSSGIMDQFAVSLGKKDQALLLNCATKHYDYVPFDLTGYKLVVMNTNKKRRLTDSKYNERFAECQKALQLLRPHFNCENLCDLSSDDLTAIASYLNDPVLYRRTAHVITENERVHQTVTALKANDMATLGKLLTASHTSLRDNYEVTGFELDTLVQAALDHGALGARMTGAGFGGCAICLVKEDMAALLMEKVAAIYKEKVGYDATLFITTASDGPMQLI